MKRVKKIKRSILMFIIVLSLLSSLFIIPASADSDFRLYNTTKLYPEDIDFLQYFTVDDYDNYFLDKYYSVDFDISIIGPPGLKIVNFLFDEYSETFFEIYPEYFYVRGYGNIEFDTCHYEFYITKNDTLGSLRFNLLIDGNLYFSDFEFCTISNMNVQTVYQSDYEIINTDTSNKFGFIGSFASSIMECVSTIFSFLTSSAVLPYFALGIVISIIMVGIILVKSIFI